MAQRVTQQVVQAAFSTTPEARVTSHVAEVLQLPPAPAARVTSVLMEVMESIGSTPLAGGTKQTVYVIAS